MQTLLLAALDEELDRVAQRIPTLSNLSSAIGDRPDSTSAVLPHPANAASVGAEIIPLRCARQAKTLAGVATIAASS